MSNHVKKCLRGLGVGLAAGLVALIAWRLGWLESWEAPTWTWRAKFFSQREIFSPEVKLILLDQASLDWAQEENPDWGWPWPRVVYGAISDFCAKGGAKALCLDLLFTDTTTWGVDDDKELGTALKAGPPAVLALMKGGNRTTWPDYMPHPNLKIELPSAVDSPNMMFPLEDIMAGAEAAGHVLGTPDADGVFRRISPFCRFDGATIPTFALAAYLIQHDPNSVTASTRRLTITDKRIPLDRQGDVILRFKGPGGLSEPLSAAAVIQSKLRIDEGGTPPLSPEVVKDRYVFVGYSAPGLLDLRPIPINPKCPGVVLHATFIENLLTDSFIAETGTAAVILGVLATAVAAAISLSFADKWWQSASLSVVWLGVPVLAGFAAYAQGQWWPVATQGLASGLALVGSLAANYLAEGRQKAFIKQAFNHYLSSDVIEKIIRDPKHLQLGGEKRELTIMFTDLAGFSTFSERLGPVELTTLLNDYLTEMTDIIMEEGGTLDKYEGDAIIAFWNAPLAQPDHAERAVRAALRCQARLAELRPDFLARFGSELHMRVGLNTGPVVVGNLGSSQRFDYSILGDGANVAARLEGVNKEFGTPILLSESCRRQLPPDLAVREIGLVRVVGRREPIRVFEPLAAPPAWLASFDQALRHYYQGDFPAALALFNSLAATDPAAARYVECCRALAAAPPPAWDGIWTMAGK